MPTYDYKCPSCQKIEPHVHRMTEDFVSICSDCNIQMIKGIGGGLAVHFNGSGFYETDYKGK